MVFAFSFYIPGPDLVLTFRKILESAILIGLKSLIS